jgi:YD repeat-containing protein
MQSHSEGGVNHTGPGHTPISVEPATGHRSKLKNLQGDGTPISTWEFSRDSNGNVLSALREDGSCWYYEYDGLQRLTSADWRNSGGSTLYGYEYQYDKAGNRTSIVANGEATYYSYNAANELTYRETLGGEQVYYAYDGRGNRLKKQVLSGHTQYFAYDARNLLTTVTSTDPSFTANYFEYNALGQRVKATDSTGTRRLIWDGLNVTHELDTTGEVSRRYTHGYSPTEGVAQILDVQNLDEPGDPRRFYVFDVPGGVVEMTDEAGDVIWGADYEPSGRVIVGDSVTVPRFTYPPTYEASPDLPLRYSPTRPLDPEDGQYTVRDLLRTVTSRYAYARQNPLAFVDPTGLAGWDIEQINRIVKEVGLDPEEGRRALHRWLGKMKARGQTVSEAALRRAANDIKAMGGKYVKGGNWRSEARGRGRGRHGRGGRGRGGIGGAIGGAFLFLLELEGTADAAELTPEQIREYHEAHLDECVMCECTLYRFERTYHRRIAVTHHSQWLGIQRWREYHEYWERGKETRTALRTESFRNITRRECRAKQGALPSRRAGIGVPSGELGAHGYRRLPDGRIIRPGDGALALWKRYSVWFDWICEERR